MALALLGSATALSPTERLSSWRTAAACTGVHVASVAESTPLSRFCSDGTVFPALTSRTQANNAAQRGDLLLNGRTAHGAARVHSGDVLTLNNPSPAPLSTPEVRRVERFFEELTEAKRERGGRFEVLHEDDELAVVFKPPGVHSTGWAGTRKKWGELTLCDALPLLLTAPSQRASLAPLPAPSPAHRLDARVGGVIAVAKTRRALAGLSTLFRERRVTKVYVAIVVGAVCIEELAGDRVDAGGRFTCTAISESEATSKSPEGGLRVEQQGEDGRLSVTEVRVLEVTPCAVHGALTTLELRPLTGRRHQLRIACALALGAPIVGDDLYHAGASAARAARTPHGSVPPLPPVRRRAGLFLQALEISLPHPATGRTLRVRAPEMRRFAKLRERAASGAAYTDEEWELWRSRGT